MRDVLVATCCVGTLGQQSRISITCKLNRGLIVRFDGNEVSVYTKSGVGGKRFVFAVRKRSVGIQTTTARFYSSDLVNSQTSAGARVTVSPTSSEMMGVLCSKRGAYCAPKSGMGDKGEGHCETGFHKCE